MDEGAASWMRAQNHPRGHGVTDKGAARGTLALWMRRAVSRSGMMID